MIRLPNYVAKALTVVNGSVDVCVIDGHYRQACIAATLPRLKPCGLLVVDNSNWLRPREWGVPGLWQEVRRFRFAGDETAIWRKPRAN